MTFSNQDATGRFRSDRRTAETVFETVEKHWDRYGLDKVRYSLKDMPFKIRHTPDYRQPYRLVEVQACGNDGVLKLQAEKFRALLLWQQEWRTDLWVWDGGRKRNQYGSIEIPTLYELVVVAGKGDRFSSDGVPFWGVKRTDLPIEWTKFEGELV
jgi:hypothetical protein